jgi:glycosyltransferase involved in cell wall biosynthesis
VTTSTFPARVDDGVPRFVYDLAKALTRHADVTALAPDAPGADRHEQAGKLRIRRFTYAWPRGSQRLALGQGMRDNLRGSWLARLQVPGFLLRQALVTRAVVAAERIDVVNAHWMVPQGLTAAWARGRRPRFRLVLHVHAGDVYLLRRLPLGRAIASYVMSRTDGLFADGSHVRDSLSELIGYDCGAVLQPMGVHCRQFGRARETGHEPLEGTDHPGGFLLFFGRMSEKKGVIYLVRALPHILRTHPDIGLVLIGDGPERSRVEQEVERLGIGRSVAFLGRRPHPEIVRYLHGCRVAVVPSIIDRFGETEGMPTVVVESMAAGVRVVGSAVDGIPDVLRHGENGWLCREKDPEDLAEKILLALDDPTAPAVAERALADAAGFDWAGVAGHYVEMMKRVTQQHSPSAGARA